MKTLCFAIGCWLSTVAGYGAPAASFCAPADSTLAFEIDIARFRMNDSTAAVEVYIAVPRNKLKFLVDGSAWQAKFASEVVISRADETGELIRHRWQATHTAHNPDEIKPGQLLFTQAQFQIPVGEYEFIVRVEDQNSSASASKLVPLSVKPFHPQNLSISDLQFASLIERDTTATLFYKNNYKVVPNPAALYGTGLPMLYTYSEIYNLSYPGDSTYSVSYRVLDGNGREAKTMPGKRHRVMGRSLVEVHAMNIAALPSGAYNLEERVNDHHSGQEAANLRKFFIYREQDAAAGAEAQEEAGAALLNHYRALPLAEIDNEFAAARYVANDEEKKLYGSLNETGKREFMMRFWNHRDQTQETARNEYRESYLARVAFANKNFSGLREGWKTDMGRVLLMYGFPSEIERTPSSGETRALQIWKYFEYEGGVEFAFVDIKGWGNYELVNSTARAELHDLNWERWLRVQ